MPENRVFMPNLRIFAFSLGFVSPYLCLAQQFSPYPSPVLTSSDLSIRKSAYRSFAPKRFTMPLFAVPLLPLHRSPSDNLFVNEILLGDGSVADAATIEQTESNLRATGLFSRMETRLDTVREKEHPQLSPREVDVVLSLFERPSIAPYLVLETGGGAAMSGVGASLSNVGGTGIALETSLVYRSENAIGWQGAVRAKWRVQESDETIPMTLEASLVAHRFRNSQEFSILSPASEKQQYNEWSVNISHHGGMEFRYFPSETASALNPAAFALQTFDSWRFNSTGIVRGSYWDTDFFLSGTVQADWTRRENSDFRSNSLEQCVLGLAEVGTEHRTAALLDDRLWGASPHIIAKTLGTAIPVGFYAQGGLISGFEISSGMGVPSQSFFLSLNRTSIFLTARAGGSIMVGKRLYFSVRGEALGENLARGEIKLHAALGNEIILASRLLAILPNGGFTVFDNDFGTRGYGANTLAGRFGGASLNVELRGLALADFGAYRLSGTLFFDVSQGLTSNIFFGGASYGAGLRLRYPAFLSSTGTDGILRLDLAFVPELGRFGQVILSTREAFTLFDDFPARQQRLIATQRFVE
ncbi:MAG: hypothetical protein H9535_20590 [Ignavibacteria bacterium]|nr:hypothetical protein [Ignavibacteria bacterium]